MSLVHGGDWDDHIGDDSPCEELLRVWRRQRIDREVKPQSMANECHAFVFCPVPGIVNCAIGYSRCHEPGCTLYIEDHVTFTKVTNK